ncbi:MAG TPA: ABC transporter permease [Bacteroidota bacterium]|nr:ABC transporter permease [Bacteroidota bacterium]
MDTTHNQRRRLKLNEYIVYLGFLLIFVFFSATLFNRGFLTGTNLLNITQQTTMISVMAIGMTFVLSAGEIDLSIGSVVALSAMITALLLRYTNIFFAVAGGMAVGAFVGFINGIFVTRVRIPSFIVTLGMSAIASGFARLITNLESVPVNNDAFNGIFGSGSLGPIPVLFLWTIALAAIGQTALRKTAFGRYALATGSNKVSSIYSGINTNRIKMAVLVLNGILASLAGILYTGRLHGARYSLGDSDLLFVIAAVIIGGTSLFGGKGTVIGAIIGSLLMGMINNGLVLMGLNVSLQMIFRGVIIIASVSLSLREAKQG